MRCPVTIKVNSFHQQSCLLYELVNQCTSVCYKTCSDYFLFDFSSFYALLKFTLSEWNSKLVQTGMVVLYTRTHVISPSHL